MTDADAEALEFIPVHRDLPPHDVAVYFLTVRDESHTRGSARRRGVRWYYADNGLEMPDPPTHWRRTP